MIIEKLCTRVVPSFLVRTGVALLRPSLLLSSSSLIYQTRSVDELIQCRRKTRSCFGFVREIHHEHRHHPPSVMPKPSRSSTFVLNTEVDPRSKILRIRWAHEEETMHPYSWLRDCCRCSACFHQGSQTRINQLSEISFTDMPVSVEANCESQELVVEWPDEHRSVFGYKWLLDHGFKSSGRQKKVITARKTPTLWNSDLQNKILTLDFQSFLKDDRVLYKWLTTLEETGIAIITDAPQAEGQLQKIATRVAFIRMTCFGPTMFVRNKDHRGSVAYMTAKLELHNDLVYYNSIPGVKMVHCIQEQGSGERGTSLFVDGFMAANQLRERFRDQFDLLSTVKLDFLGLGKDYTDYQLRSEHSTIRLDNSKNVTQIVYNSKARQSSLDLEVEKVEPFYNALKNFADILNSPQNLVEVNLGAGDIVCLNNWRVLHGKTPYQVVPGSEAVVQRGYIDWDEMFSQKEILQTELGICSDD